MIYFPKVIRKTFFTISLIFSSIFVFASVDTGQNVIDISGKNITIKNIDGPTGVRGRNSDNALIQEKLGWSPTDPLYEGLIETFEWIDKQVNNDITI